MWAVSGATVAAVWLVFSMAMRSCKSAFEESVFNRLDKITKASQLLSDLGPISDIADKKKTLLQSCCIALDTEMATLYVIDPCTGRIQAASTQSVTKPVEEAFYNLYAQRLTDRGATGAWVVMDAAASGSQDPECAAILSQHGISAIAAGPIRSGSSIAGAIVAFFEHQNVRPKELMCAIEVLSAQSSTALSYTSSLEESNFMLDDLAVDNKELAMLATADGLTGLCNHRKFQQELSELCRKSLGKPGRQFCLVMADVDHFKSYNDAYGHRQGDEVLQKVSQAISDGLRQGDIAARYGGEEFAIIILRTDKDAAYSISDRIRQDISELHLEQGHTTISMGIAEFPSDATAPGELIECADKALYQAKKAGRNQARIWSSPAYSQDIDSETDISQAA